MGVQRIVLGMDGTEGRREPASGPRNWPPPWVREFWSYT